MAVDFSTESLTGKLKPWSGGAGAIVVTEGVSQCLTQSQFRATLDLLRAGFLHHTIFCDLTREDFRQRYTGEFREKLRLFGTCFETLTVDPPRAVLEAGCELVERTSMVVRARELGAPSPASYCTRLTGLCATNIALTDSGRGIGLNSCNSIAVQLLSGSGQLFVIDSLSVRGDFIN